MEPRTLLNCSTAEYMKVFGAKLNDAQVEFFNEWDRYTRIAMSRAFDKLIWGDPRDGYHQFLFDDDGA